MNTLITGGTGFLGRALARRLAADGHRVTALGSSDADLTRPGSLDRFAGPFDRVYHLAAWTRAGDFCLRHPGEQWVKNQLINTTVLDWWQRRQPRAKLVAIGTSCAYAPGCEPAEENFLAGTPVESLYTYAMTKRMLCVGLRALAQQFGLRWLMLVPSTVYGPGYHTDGRPMHFVFDLIRKVLAAKRGGPAPVLWGDGHQTRELVYVDDFVDATARLADAAGNELVNVGSGEEHSIREFAAAVCGVAGYDPELVRYDPSKYVGARSKVLRVEKLRRLLPGRATTPLRDGLAKTVAWFDANWDVIGAATPRAA